MKFAPKWGKNGEFNCKHCGSEVRLVTRRAAHVIEAIVAMSLGWHSLYAGQWLFWTLTSGEGAALSH
eukprot:1544884-Amphidinium_carterae.1